MPEIGPGEVLMKVKSSGICGTDVMEWYRIDRAPLILGHEVAGEIIAAGDEVTDHKIGDRIVAAHHVPCNNCQYCFSGHETVCDTLRKTNFDPGGFSEYIRLPAENVQGGIYRLPDVVSFDEGTFVEPLACVLRGQRIAGLKPGQSVFVIGSGISGLLHIQLASALGAGRIIASDVSAYRRELAEKMGAEKAFSPEQLSSEIIREINSGRLVDLAIICSGAPSVISQAIKMTERGGTVLFFAAFTPKAKIDLPVNDIFWRNELTLISSYAGGRADHTAALELIRAKRLKVKELITHRLKLEEIKTGFKLVTEADKSVKVIINPGSWK